MIHYYLKYHVIYEPSKSTTNGLFPLSKVLKTKTAVLLAGRVDPVRAGDVVVVVIEVNDVVVVGDVVVDSERRLVIDMDLFRLVLASLERPNSGEISAEAFPYVPFSTHLS